MTNKQLKSIRFPGLPDTYIIPEIDATLTQSGQAADARATGDAITELNNKSILTNETIYGETNIPVYQTVTGWRLNASDGLCSSNSSYQLVKYEVTAGSIVKVVSDDLFQFQSAATVPSAETSYRVGNTYGTGTFYLSVPNSAKYIVLSTPISDSNAVAYLASSTVDEIKNEVSNLRKRSNNLLNANNADIVKLINNNGTTNPNTKARSVVVPVTITTQTKITATKTVASSRFAIATFTDYPVMYSTSDSVKSNNSATSLTIAVDSTIKYVMIYFWLESADTTVTPQEVLNGMMVEFGDTFTEYEPYYVPAISDSQIAEITDNIRLTVTSGVNPLFYSTQLMAHRGTSTAPENTMSAYKQAYANGLRMMETDIKFSSDNIPVLLHDDTIDRTSDGSGTCSSIPLETLKTYDFGSWFSSSFAGEKIPTLAEFLVFCKTHNCVAELDLADSNYDEPHLIIIYGVVKQCGMLKNTVFTVYNSAAAILRSIDKNIILCIGGITNESLAYNAISKNYGCALLILSLPIANFSEQLALYIANLGCKVRTWVVNDAETAVTTFESCCDYILTDSLKKNDIVFD